MDPVTIGALGVLGAILTGAGWIARKAWPAVRKLNHFVDDVLGEPARPGVQARPGLMERMTSVESDLFEVKAEVKNSHKTNLRDDLDRVEHKVNDLHMKWVLTHGSDRA